MKKVMLVRASGEKMGPYELREGSLGFWVNGRLIPTSDLETLGFTIEEVKEPLRWSGECCWDKGSDVLRNLIRFPLSKDLQDWLHQSSGREPFRTRVTIEEIIE